MSEKMDFSKQNFCFMRFCIEGHLLRLYRGHVLRAREPQSDTYSEKCHAQGKVPQLQNIYFIERK